MATGISKNKWDGKENNLSTGSLDGGIRLSYDGKSDPVNTLNTPASETRLLWKSRTNNLNRLYYGDNLGILAKLRQDNDIRGNVRLVYIDPPFATNSVFKSRKQKDAYRDLLLGSEYLEFIRARLILLRELLAEDGSIYVHLDSNMTFYVKILMDEIFGVNNFRSFITRRKSNPKNYTRSTYGNVSDYILFYTKSDNYVWNRAYREWTDDNAAEEYQYVEKDTGRRYKKVPIHAPGIRNGDTGKPWKGMEPPPGKHWQYRRETLDEMDKRGEIYWSANGNPRRKVYLDKSEGIPVQDIWLDVKDAHNQNIRITGYPTEKPMELLERIIKASSNEGDLVLDCFAGSGTTLHTASNLDRKWIGIDESPEALSTILKRFSQGLEPMGDFVKKQKPYQKKLPFEFDLSQDLILRIEDFSLFASLPYDGAIDEEVQKLSERI